MRDHLGSWTENLKDRGTADRRSATSPRPQTEHPRKSSPLATLPSAKTQNLLARGQPRCTEREKFLDCHASRTDWKFRIHPSREVNHQRHFTTKPPKRGFLREAAIGRHVL